MKHLDLFSGIGGFALACQWAGIETIGFVEIDKYCQKVLRKHWPDVPIVEDIRDVKAIKEIVTNATREGLSDRRGASLGNPGKEKPESERCGSSPSGSQVVENTRCQYDEGQLLEREHETTVRQGATDTLERPDSTSRNSMSDRSNGESPALLITAGFPCQPFSVAGKREGEADDRYLWPQTIAVIKAIKPEWVLLENVTGIINLALDTVLFDLEGAGYGHETLIIPACAVNAWHRRDRVWIVAYQFSKGLEKWEKQKLLEQCETIERDSFIANTNHAKTSRQRGHSRQVYGDAESEGFDIRSGKDWWAIKPELGRVAHGVPHRVDRLKCLGNAIVPQVAYEIIKVIKEVNG